MFINREKELKLLMSEYKSNDFRFTVIYGRRRVGKTTLIKEYIKNKPSIYFLSTLENINISINRFKDLVANYFEDSFLKEIDISSFKQLFEYISNKNFNQKLIIIIDEFQYLSKQNSSIPSQFQYIVDEFLQNKNIHLILCGSIISMMYEQTLSYNSPLYGRRTSAIRLEAISFEYINEFFPNKTKKELIELYAVFYGVPKYLLTALDDKDIFTVIKNSILNKDSYLYNEPLFILQNEVNEPVTYFSILEVIANGEHKIGNIASKLNKNVYNITSFISKLIDLDLIYKEVPITEKNPQKSKKGLYFIKDNFFRFWFRYVLPNKSLLEIEEYEYVLSEIKESFSEFVSKVYEDLAIRYLKKKYPLLKCGRWWDKNSEIDAVGTTKDYLIIAECKYSNKKVGVNILKELKEKAQNINSKLPIKKYILFSKSGFTKELLELRDKNVELIELLKKIDK